RAAGAVGASGAAWPTLSGTKGKPEHVRQHVVLGSRGGSPLSSVCTGGSPGRVVNAPLAANLPRERNVQGAAGITGDADRQPHLLGAEEGEGISPREAIPVDVHGPERP